MLLFKGKTVSISGIFLRDMEVDGGYFGWIFEIVMEQQKQPLVIEINVKSWKILDIYERGF